MYLTLLQYGHIAISVLLVIAILIQNRSSGLSSTFGGTGAISTTKRGPEKVVYRTTVVLAVLFVLSSVAFVFVR